MINDKYGNTFNGYHALAGKTCLSELKKSISISLVIAKDAQSKAALVHNRFRKHWELPGGFINKGETPEMAAIREMHEETGIQLADCRLMGIMDFYSAQRETQEFAAIYGASLGSISDFHANEEVDRFCLWDCKENLSGHLSELDAELIRLNANI